MPTQVTEERSKKTLFIFAALSFVVNTSKKNSPKMHFFLLNPPQFNAFTILLILF